MPSTKPHRCTLSSVHREFVHWRSRRSRGQRIPKDLWSSAVDLAHEHGVSQTAQALGLDYYALKKRVEVESSVEVESKATAPVVEFLELPLAAASPSASCVVELEDGRGARLRVALEGTATREVEAVARALWAASR